MIQVKARRNCYECKDIPKPDCPECKGTGRVERWVDLETVAKAIKHDEPIEAVVNLSKLGL